VIPWVLVVVLHIVSKHPILGFNQSAHWSLISQHLLRE